ncbi:MerR family transcriptional regulator [Mesoplasma chauliocola]|uniref:MerR family transcriptional regulator n=1 Tax=Mesoplasma chauliocola TaxID=216427 RepID=A0A249SN18_9MOLU|nr:MerR family transcriptional regulator [Mesoplasma chauliocola]ASZ09010.1 MerR family transcriptional regulator [Mesoplasma chauliocola]
MEKMYIKDISKELDIPEYILRFYDKKGLIPFMQRDDSNNYRYINREKIEWVRIVSCLKKSGMPLAQIKEYIDLAIQGKQTYPQRLEMMLEQERQVKKQINELKEQLKYIQYKKSLYSK